MLIPRKALHRRTVLRGMFGTAVALPLLEAMSPNAKAADVAAAARKAATTPGHAALFLVSYGEICRRMGKRA